MRYFFVVKRPVYTGWASAAIQMFTFVGMVAGLAAVLSIHNFKTERIMKKTFSLLCLVLASGYTFAQVELPVPSPKARVEQRIGITDISIDYSRPGVNGRKIWGGLVPYDKVWRTGANSATAITFSKDVEIGGKAIKAGEYALFSIPSASEWTFIINSNEGQKGSTDYKETLDIARVKAKPVTVPATKERLEFTIDPVSDNEATITLRWESLAVSFNVSTNTLKNTENSIAAFEKKSGGLWLDLARAAQYSNDNNLNADKTLAWVDRSIALNDHFFNKWVKAQILHKKGDAAGAYSFALAAKEYGDKNPSGFYDVFKPAIETALADWAGAAPKGKPKK